MTNYSSERRSFFSALTYIRRSFLLVALVCGPALHAQLTFSETNSIPRSVDGGAFPVFFNFSSQLPATPSEILHTRISIDFRKEAALSDDPPFYSDIGLILRKLDQSFSVLSEVTLLYIGGFNDGFASSFFDGVITFDDDAMTVINNNPDQPTSGLFRPMEALSLLSGSYSPYWELRLVDAVSDSPLLFHSATLTTTIAAAVPEPAFIGLAGVCLLGLVALQRRQVAQLKR